MRGKFKRLIQRVLPAGMYDLGSNLWCNIVVVVARLWHKWNILKIRWRVKRNKPIRVLFIDSEIAKWKTQSLFELMKHDKHYVPVVGISRRDSDLRKASSEIYAGIKEARAFFEGKGNACVEIYDSDKRCGIDLRKFSPDIVFYQQSWYDESPHCAWQVYKVALTCHIPYFTPNYGFPEIEACRFFHRFLAYYFLLSDQWIEYYRKGVPSWFYSGRMIGSGQPMFDQLSSQSPRDGVKTIIYAPHFSISSGNNILKFSTFLENGVEILEYAKGHREFNWIFKPHPVLYTALINQGNWSREKVDAYYSEWESIGNVCLTCDYMDMFSKADAMITDCGSFLPEFGATGKPIIHLISSRNNYVPAPPSIDLFSSFYEARSLDEMYALFKCVLEEALDPKKEIRLAAVKRANLSGQNAAKNIMDFFDKEFRIKR